MTTSLEHLVKPYCLEIFCMPYVMVCYSLVQISLFSIELSTKCQKILQLPRKVTLKLNLFEGFRLYCCSCTVLQLWHCLIIYPRRRITIEIYFLIFRVFRGFSGFSAKNDYYYPHFDKRF